ncbi:hypothetical protein ABS71_16945 [bacterium SCN 62-11]|nr:DUF4198 domain-containing protein [Candidatus Eremiobacteraeota bacterium]ODT61315.1 MAG: hypothetical protein ABS71_16945 [bacterium SCN 62-11]
MLRKIFLVLALGQMALAHDFWLKPQGQKAALWYGHASEDSEYDRANLKKASAFSAKGDPVKVAQTSDGKHVVLVPEAEAAQMAVEMDTGFWSKTVQGWKNESKRAVSGALLSEWSIYYSKVLLKPEACLNKSFGQTMELIPVALHGKNLKVRLVLRGKGLADVKLYDEHQKVADTDAAGEATVTYSEAMVLSAGYREPLQNNPDADRLNLHAVLSLP